MAALSICSKIEATYLTHLKVMGSILRGIFGPKDDLNETARQIDIHKILILASAPLHTQDTDIGLGSLV